MNNKNTQIFVISALVLVALIVYFFVSAPAPLPDEEVVAGELIPVETMLKIIARENDVVRALYTKEIVGAGQKAGLAFGEEWRDRGVDQGPLPALFLREASTVLEKSPVPLGLFLGSDFPISPSNNFQGIQTEKFETIKATREAEFFYSEDTALYTAMFPDFASAQPCVDCHNAHPDSPKTNWQLDDVMGATTWSYPKEFVTTEELLTVIKTVRQGFSEAYGAYIAKSESFENRPEVGEQWPRDGYFLPSVDTFMAEFASRASSNTVDALVVAVGEEE